MSIISGDGKMLHLLKCHNSAVKAKKIAKPEYRESKCSSILLLSLAISVAIILLIFVGLSYTSSAMHELSTCRQKIDEFEQQGIYSSPEQFGLALSYCTVK